jgi:hypothetical protein
MFTFNTDMKFRIDWHPSWDTIQAWLKTTTERRVQEVITRAS